MKFRGKKYLCPVCNFSASQFLNSPGNERKNVRCPRCSSLERHRAQWLFGLNQLNFSGKNHFSVLHFSPEFCISRKFINLKKCNYKTAEFLPDKLSDYCIDIQNTGLPKESFELIICNHILEHVENDHVAIAELYRILKTGGKAFLQVPLDNNQKKTFEDPSITDPEERSRMFGQKDHLRVYGRDISDRLSDCGFIVSYIEYWKQTSKENLAYYAIDQYEPVIVCQKG